MDASAETCGISDEVVIAVHKAHYTVLGNADSAVPFSP
jgi:hypothetical protein